MQDYIELTQFSEGTSIIEYEGKFDIIKRGEPVKTPLRYDSISSFDNKGLIRVGIGWLKYGFVSRLGVEIIPLKYHKASDFNDGGFATVCINNKWGILNTSGDELTPLIYDNIQYNLNPDTGEYFMKVTVSGKSMCIDKDLNFYPPDILHAPYPWNGKKCRDCSCYNDFLITKFCCQLKEI